MTYYIVVGEGPSHGHK